MLGDETFERRAVDLFRPIERAVRAQRAKDAGIEEVHFGMCGQFALRPAGKDGDRR